MSASSLIRKLAVAATLALASLAATASELGIQATEAYARTQQTETPVLLVDVRDPVEIMFVGGTDVADINIPFLLVDRSQWNEERGVFRMAPNPDFVAQVRAELASRNLPENTEVITMCRSGSERGKPSAELLQSAGLNARYIVHGFQGDAIKDGEQAGLRLLNGWQNSGLPWGQLSADKFYRPDVQ